MTLRRWLDREEPVNETAEAEDRPRGEGTIDHMRGYVDIGERDERAAQAPDLAQLGEHVTSVLAAAESAAQKLRSDAEQDAQRTREQAAEAADTLRERAATDAEAERAEARRQVSLAEEEAQATRAEADSYAERRRREANDEAMRLVRDAEQRASQLASIAAERHRVLLVNVSASETRMRNLAGSLRDVASRLEEVSEGAKPGDGLDAALDRSLIVSVTDDNPRVGSVP
jgi:hypothetical protein